LKEYLLQYRDTIISYERAIDVMYKHLMEAYSPFRMRLEIKFRPRGGISSKMVVDSDWGHLGGTDKIWQHHNADF
jgi:7-cyano-7-deazaguanine reductase